MAKKKTPPDDPDRNLYEGDPLLDEIRSLKLPQRLRDRSLEDREAHYKAILLVRAIDAPDDPDGIQILQRGISALEAVRKPRRSRLHPVLVGYIKTRQRRNKSLTASELYDDLQRYDADENPAKAPGGEIGFLRGTLKIYSLKYGDKSFTKKKFCEYFRACKNPPTLSK